MIFIVTGSGHSGTGWASKFFTELGYLCGHEEWLNFREFQGLQTADSSWMAIPRLNQLQEYPVIHLLRDPIPVVKSLLRAKTHKDVNTKSPYVQYIYETKPDFKKYPDELGRCILRACDWDEPVLNHPKVLTVKIEDRSISSLQRMVRFASEEIVSEEKIKRALSSVSPKYNTHAPGSKLNTTTEDIFNHPLGYKVKERMEKYGYE